MSDGYIQQVATALNGNEIQNEITPEVTALLSGSDLVVVFGASDDLMEFRGAIDDEVGVNDGGKAYLDGNGLLENKCDEDNCPYFQKERSQATVIEALWCHGDEISWQYATEIPHSTFEIMEDGEVYCRGIVFRLSSI